MKTVKGKIGIILAIIMVLTMIPVSSFGEGAPSVTFNTQPTSMTGENALTEGEITGELSVSASADADVAMYTFYQWFACDDVNKTNPVAVTDNGGNASYELPEGLWTDGSNDKDYYYYCTASFYNMATNEFIVKGDSNVAAVTVKAGTKYAIFDPNGGTFAEIINNAEPQKVAIGADGKLKENDIPREPAMEDLKFAGWSLDGSAEGIIDPAAYKFKHTTRLYAVYGEKHLAVFDANGGAFAYGGSDYYVGYTFGVMYKEDLPADPTREGYAFDGWYFKTDSGKEISLEHNYLNEIDGYFLPKSNYDIYAKWTVAGGASGEGSEGVQGEPEDLNAVEKVSSETATGDNSNMLPWVIVGIIALLAGAVTVLARREKFEE